MGIETRVYGELCGTAVTTNITPQVCFMLRFVAAYVSPKYLVSVPFLSVLVLGLAVQATEPKLEYNRDIRPILSENCFACHGFDEKARQADLRLDTSEAALADRDGNAPIVPGNISKSIVWERIISEDEATLMPPPTSNHSLTALQKGKIKSWIEQGAPYEGHWAFIPPKKPMFTQTGASQTGASQTGQDNSALQPIDALVRARLKEEELEPSQRADRATLIRRVSLDLTGLPPSSADVEVFVNDQNANSYGKLVDRLLQSEHFGERLALEWLDSARYADTNGFSIDGGRHMWLWRDWVIQSFNDNLPYDRFLIEQLAGDLLPNRTDAQLIATGFQRNNMVTHEGGTIPEENLTNYNADRIKTLGESVLGLTLACAQCHDHKYDPISQREYYQMFAFFNSLSDKGLDGNGGINPGPTAKLKTVLKTGDEESRLRAEIAKLESILAVEEKSILSAWSDRESKKLAERGRDFQAHSLKLLKVSTPNRGAGFDIEDETRVRLKDPGGMGAFDVSAELPQLDHPITGIRMVVFPVPQLPGGGWGKGPSEKAQPKPKPGDKADTEKIVDSLKGSFMLTAIAATVDRVASDQINLFKMIGIESVTANSWEPGNEPSGCLDPRNDSGWSPSLETEGPVRLTANFRRPVQPQEASFITVQVNFGNGRELVPQLFELQVITGKDDDSDLPRAIIDVLQISQADRSVEQSNQLWDYCAKKSREYEAIRVELTNLRERLKVLSESHNTMVMDVASKPRDTFILNRGDYAQPMDKVSPAAPAVLPPFPPDATADRLGLAMWLTQKEHPLTARVAVNRFWKMLFGNGLVSSLADFGSQGDWPSHPDLLDYLAVDFVEHDWDVKDLIRKIVTSETYTQSSVASDKLIERDPQNRLLARGPRFRLSAELIRDSVLKTSGLLVSRVGGPSVNPYMPGDLWREVSHYGSSPATAQAFVQDHGEKLYRRSMYTYWKRTAPPPNMTAFDAPNREVCTVSRGNTTTPLQALVTLNDPQFVEAARAFADRILGQRNTTDENRIRWAFTETTSRLPTEKELNVLALRLHKERSRFSANPDQALKYLSVGESKIKTDSSPSELAAWSQIASILLNLSETVTRN